MTRNQLIKYFEKRGYSYHRLSNFVWFEDNNGDKLFSIFSTNNVINTHRAAFKKLDYETQKKYYKVIFDYLMTPPIDRDDRLFTVRLSGINPNENYLRKDIHGYHVGLNAYGDACLFTRKDIEHFPNSLRDYPWITEVQECSR